VDTAIGINTIVNNYCERIAIIDIGVGFQLKAQVQPLLPPRFFKRLC
jgi:hypothetical protein